MTDNPKKASAEDRELVALFAGLDTPGVSDALDKLGLHGQAFGIRPLVDYPDVTVGPAFTVKYIPASSPAGTVGDFIDDVAEGDIIVIDIPSRSISVKLSDEELAARPQQPLKRNRVVSKALRAYAQSVSSADKGGIRIID